MVSGIAADMKRDSVRGLVAAARLGYAAKGIVYCVLGALALLYAFGEGGRLTDRRGALRQIDALPLGDTLLWVIAGGLGCYALWNALRAVFGCTHWTEEHPFKRVGYAVGFLWNGLLAFYAGQLASGIGRSDGGTKTLVAKLMALPLGALIVGATGVITVGFGLYQVWRAVQGDVGRELGSAQLSPRGRRMAHRFARAGVAARGVVFPIIGASLVTAALHERPGRAYDFGEALGELGAQSWSSLLLGVVAAGLIAYGLYQLYVARFGNLDEPRV
jgi:hypothetical protein